MNIREPCLPPGWYPRARGKIEEFLEPFAKNRVAAADNGQVSVAAISPHAGWYFSGACAAASVSSLDPGAETVAVIGGHLGRGMPVLTASEEGVRTPLGTMPFDLELRDEFRKGVALRSDQYADNTVEVLLPMVHYFFPHSRLLWLRFPAEISSYKAGKLLFEAAASLGRRIVVLSSTDLTHYGNNYNFSPKGSGKTALEWVKKVNDAAFISAVLGGDPSLVLKRAEEDWSACSAGSVLGALGFTASAGKTTARLLDYRTSADADDYDEIPDSFVGYASISFITESIFPIQ